MKKITANFLGAILCLSASITSIAQQNPPTAKAKYVVLISIDGLRPEFYLEKSWPTPNLQFMKENGAYAEGVNGIFPTVTYPSHTTIITGATPARHGIYYNAMFSDSGSTNKWYREEKFIQTPTLWDAVRKAGLTSAVVSWPVSVGAPVDYLVPEDWQDDRNGTRPVNPYITPVGLWEELQREATGKLPYSKLTLDNLAIDENFSRMAAHLIKTYKPNFTTLHIVSVDHGQHSVGRQGDAVNKALAAADHALSNILEAVEFAGIKDSTTIIVTGDHGFVNVHSSFSPNIILSRLGLLPEARDKSAWKAMFHSSGGAAFLHLKDKKDVKTLSRIKAALDSLPPAVKKLFRVVEKPELVAIGADPNAVLALAAVEGISISGANTGELVRPGRGGTHGYFPEFKNIQTGFVAYGAGINKSAVIPVMGLVDIAPVISQLLGLSFEAPDGILLPGVLQSPRRERPVVNANITPVPSK